jgi:hypothetical protein
MINYMERGLTMALHSFIIGILLYFLMTVIFGLNATISENRSILISSVMLIYMILFGHDLPKSINRNI